MTASRFAYDAPGPVRMIWLMVINPTEWRKSLRAWITDQHTGETFQLSAEEDVMMGVLSKNMDEVTRLEGVPLSKLNAFWTPELIDTAKDELLAAISDRRRGDDTQWERFATLNAGEWIDWLQHIRRGSSPKPLQRLDIHQGRRSLAP